MGYKNETDPTDISCFREDEVIFVGAALLWLRLHSLLDIALSDSRVLLYDIVQLLQNPAALTHSLAPLPLSLDTVPVIDCTH